ncbi:hypothetical protein [Mesorhizobium sp. M1329]|uniref:hypothetical protein n=1 Tax=Mesorhizobium sp. M1329 TaxID=2957083 RepID=UPI003334F744
MGEARRRREEIRGHLLAQVNEWSFPPTPWEAAVVAELLDREFRHVERLSDQELQYMRMPSNECHANARWFEKNDPTRQAKSVTGWWVQGLNFVLHSVLSNGKDYRCITPSIGDERNIPFIPDIAITWIETGEVYSATRNGQLIGVGVRRFPALTIAQNAIIRSRLLAGYDPYRAGEFTAQEMRILRDAHLTVSEIQELERPKADHIDLLS